MKVGVLLFRFRVAVMVLLHLIGFFTPWRYFAGGNVGTLWLAASTLVARTGWLNLANATLTITILGLACLVTGTCLRVWGTYAYLRNSLSIGSCLIGMATSLLMPLDGAALFLVTCTGLLFFLSVTDEHFPATKTDRLRAVLQETYPVGLTLCFAAFAWRYNAHLLIRCLLVCFGFSLVMRAVTVIAKDTNSG